MPPGELVDPIPYAPWWPWVALGIALAVVGWFVWVVLSTRAPADVSADASTAARPASTARRTDPPTDPYAALRTATLTRLDAVERRYRAGEVDLRGANLEIRAAMREFATVRTGVDTTAMTAARARADRRTRPLATVLESTSVPAFAASTRARLPRALDQARRRVRTW